MRDLVRMRFIDFDARRDPKTDHWCVMCQKELNPDRPCRWVRLVDVSGAPNAVLPEDAILLDRGELKLPPRSTDYGMTPIGRDCARVLGIEWTTGSKEVTK